jgi:hypothetical protein
MYPIDTQDGLFHDGDGISELGTILPASWLNQVQQELIAVLSEAEIIPEKANTTQVVNAIKLIISNNKAAFAGVADSAKKLQTARAINSVPFDGTQDINVTPAGAVQFFAMSTAPIGWLKANGAAVSRTRYANLFAAIGTRFGAGDGKTTFNLPDLRGEFLRGWDDGRGLDANRDLGTVQRYQVVNHTHGLQGWTGPSDILVGKRTRFLGIGGIAVTSGDGGVLYSDKIGIDVDPAYRMLGTLGVYNNLDAGSENRPRNIALLACIKI